MASPDAGARIRARRSERGLTQADLARRSEISASYLNLIEHGRRAVGAQVLGRIAAALDVDAAVLSDGADAAVLTALSTAARRSDGTVPETTRTDGFAAEFPGWAGLVIAQSDRIMALEAQVAALGDRMAHDPALSASVHDVLSVVTAIRSTAGILASGDPLEREWQDRFHRNIHEDSQRLAQSAQGLAAYLADGTGSDQAVTPSEEVEAWLAARDFAVKGTESIGPGSSAAGQAALERHLEQVRADVALLDPDLLRTTFIGSGQDPFATVDALAARGVNVHPGVVLRSIARLPQTAVGLVECDVSGAVLFRRPIPGFDVPRAGAACALWPVFQMLMTPDRPRRDVIRQAGHDALTMEAYSVAEVSRSGGLSAPVAVRATMLLRPADPGDVNGPSPTPPLGSTCRLCTVPGCIARREASVL